MISLFIFTLTSFYTMIQLYYMSDYVTTNIRIPEDDYLRLKAEAAKRRKSLSAVVREKISTKEKPRSKVEIAKLMARLAKLRKDNAKYFKGTDGVAIIREMRDNAKW